MKPREFKDPTRLCNAIMLVLCVEAVANLTAIIAEARLMHFIRRVQADAFASPQAAADVGDAIDQQVTVAYGIQLAVFLIAAVMILMWIYRVNSNARSMGAQDMRFTPGWSVGWYFIPIANLWKPYQAMKEIWKASANPADWKDAPRPGLLPLWWTLLLANGWLEQRSFVFAMKEESLDQLFASSALSLAAGVAGIALDIVFMILVKRLTTLQTVNANPMRTAEVFD